MCDKLFMNELTFIIPNLLRYTRNNVEFLYSCNPILGVFSESKVLYNGQVNLIKGSSQNHAVDLTNVIEL